MKKSIVWVVLVVAIILVGGFYLMPKEVKKEAQEQSNLTEQNVAGDMNQNSDTENLNDKVLNVVSAESKATYEINEDLRGKRTHVVGNSSAISGTIILNASNGIAGGQIKVDANSFQTDIAARDGNVKKLILKADQPGNEFIIFKAVNVTYPLDTTSAPHVAEIGKDVPITVTGDMTIAGVTKTVSFNGSANLGKDGSIHIKAKTVLAYGDFGLAIPNFPFLANVDKTADLSIELVAR